jgi:hypothetical protein
MRLNAVLVLLAVSAFEKPCPSFPFFPKKEKQNPLSNPDKEALLF